MHNPNSSDQDGLQFIALLFRHRKTIMFALILSVVAAVLITILMKHSYESSGIIFPTPTNSPDKILAEPQFGYEVDADWLMQVLRSEIVRDSLNVAFDLVNYFELDTDKKGWMDDFRKEYKDLVDFERTKYMSIEIIATTHQPELSANIVNYVIDHIDGIRENIFKANTYQTLQHFENIYFEKNEVINNLIDSIYHLRNNNTTTSLDLLYKQIKTKQKEVNTSRNELNDIRNKYKFYDLKTHVEEINAGLNSARQTYTNEMGKYEVFVESFSKEDTVIINTEARIEGASRNIENLEEKLKQFDDIQRKYDELIEKIQAGLEQLRKLNEQYDNTINAFEPFTNSIRLERLSNDYTHQQLLLNELRYQYESTLHKYHNPIPSVYVINRAEASYEKVSPLLWKNALILVLATLVFVIGVLLITEKYKSVKSAFNEESD